MDELEKHDSVDESKPQFSDGAEIDKKYTVQLTENEVFYLNHMLTADEAGISASERIIQKIAFCLLSFRAEITNAGLTSHGQPSISIFGSRENFRSSASKYIEVEFGKADLWALRKIVYSEVEIDEEKVGKNLTVKIARALHGAAYMERVNSDRLLLQVFPDSGAYFFKGGY